jgi:tetratricopeptide (TPR) repeat protein
MRYTFIFLIGTVLIIGCSKHSQSSGSANQDSSVVSNWTPPENPNPQKIYSEAQEDTDAGQYANALAKYVWFFQSALKYDPAQSGVRVSFALGSWAKLGESYPPALDKLKAVRDEAEQNVRQGTDALNAFGDFVAIDDTLKDYSKTSELFIWLDANKPELAKTAFDRTQHQLLPALVREKQYQLCGKFIDANSSFDKILRLYRTTTKHAATQNDTGLKNFEDKYFINRTTTLIALLSITDRKADAQQIVDRISKESDLPEFKAEIEKALNGEMPALSP